MKKCQVSQGDHTWVRCASENGQCSFSGERVVAYGSYSKLSFRLASNSIACNNNNFGDPANAEVKSCWYYESIDQSKFVWTKCSNEYGVCYFKGTQVVRYGTMNKPNAWNYVTATNQILCSNIFGDPANSYKKECYYQSINEGGCISPYLLYNSKCLVSNSCPSGKYLLLSQRICFDICPNDVFMSRDTLRCFEGSCPENYKYMERECFSGGCPAGTLLNYDNQTCVTRCPGGSFKLSNQCIRDCPAAMKILDNYECVTDCGRLGYLLSADQVNCVSTCPPDQRKNRLYPYCEYI